MKKVININFQGIVIPIEETAYELLKQYVESLRRYFANEEGRDEIINDIESRIAELFSERLKKGATCITDEDVNVMIANMGRPEDFEAEAAEPGIGGSQKQQSSQQQSQQAYTYATNVGRGRLYRNADDKIIGGVCSGLANYFGFDPVFMRIIFVILLFFGGGFLLYIVLWIVIPAKSLKTNITKRLYRSADNRVIGGVCAGLAAYFNVAVWIPRLIFALPIIIGLISGPFGVWWHNWDFWWGPKILTGSLSGTLFITYIILWIAVPVATTSSEKLEMRGEKVDLNTIRNTVKEDLESFKSKAQTWASQELGDKAKEYSQAAGMQAKTYASEAGQAVRSAGSGIGHVIGVLFKAFFLFIAAIITLSLFGALTGMLFGGFVVFPFKNFILDGFWQNTLAWSTLLFFLGVPIVALIIWLVRRIIGVRSKNHYLGYVFGSLWVIGLFSAILLAGALARNFKTGSEIQEEMNSFVQPPKGKLYVDVAHSDVRYYGGDWFGMEWDEDWPIYGINQDTLMLNTVRVNVVKSKDTAFHVYKVSFSRGNNPEIARQLAERIKFDIVQKDSLLILPKGFPITRQDKFRNQRVMAVIEVPVGKRIQLDRNIDGYDWFTVNVNRRRGWNIEWDQNWDNNYNWRSGVEYIMTPDGLERVDRLDEKELKKGKYQLKKRDDENGNNDETEPKKPDTNKTYRYRPEENKADDKKDSAANKIKSVSYRETEGEEATESIAAKTKRTIAEFARPVSVFTRSF